MSLRKYFVFVASAVVLLLLGRNWLSPDSTAEPVHSSIQRPVIRISSTLPERVVFDTSLPHMAPPSSLIRGAAQSGQSTFTFEKITPRSLPASSTLAQVTPKAIAEKRDPEKPTAKRDSAKKVATNRVAPQAHTVAVKNHPVREIERPIRTAELDAKPPSKATLLDEIAGHFGQIFKTN